MPKSTLRQRLRYRFDTFMARGGSSIFLSLLVVFFASLGAVSVLRILLRQFVDADGAQQFNGFLAHVYVTFLQLTDPGNMNLDIPSTAVYKASAIVAGSVGVIIFSMLIAVITTALDQKLSQLKKGHSKVIEDGHTLILGWSERVVEIVRELVLANESEDDPCVVILSELDKETMDDELAIRLPDTQNTRIVTRSGSVSSLVNLDIVSLDTAKSVIVLAEGSENGSSENKARSDTRVLKTLLGVMASKDPDGELNVVAELFDPQNRQIAREISPGEITTVNAPDILAKILVQTSRSIGLSLVYGEVMSFDGCEMYFYSGSWPAGTPFGRLPYHFADGVPLGIRRSGGELLINPAPNVPLSLEDEILILAEDDSTIAWQSEPVARPRALPLPIRRHAQRVENELVLGWSPKAPTILREYADYVLEGSAIHVMVRDPDDTLRVQLRRLQEGLPHIRLSLIDQDPMRPENLLEVQPFLYDNILILSQSGGFESPETTDSETIILLLLLRSIRDRSRQRTPPTKLISEVLDSANQELVAQAGVNDFIISNQLVSMLLAQISEEPDIARVYDDLFQEDGSEIYLKAVTLYFDTLPAEITFADLIALAQRRGELCIGVKIAALEDQAEANYGVKLIPEKTTTYRLEEGDCLVVLAEDET